MKTVKAYISGKDTVTVLCYQCGKSKEIDVSLVRDVYAPRRARCPCGAEFNILFEKRRQFRKTVRLMGKIWKADPGRAIGITILSIARAGIGFRVLHSDLSRDENEQQIKPGDSLFIEFALDNEHKTLIQGIAIVQSIEKNIVGAELSNLDVHMQKQLGYYMMP